MFPDLILWLLTRAVLTWLFQMIKFYPCNTLFVGFTGSRLSDILSGVMDWSTWVVNLKLMLLTNMKRTLDVPHLSLNGKFRRMLQWDKETHFNLLSSATLRINNGLSLHHHDIILMALYNEAYEITPGGAVGVHTLELWFLQLKERLFRGFRKANCLRRLCT